MVSCLVVKSRRFWTLEALETDTKTDHTLPLKGFIVGVEQKQFPAVHIGTQHTPAIRSFTKKRRE